MTEKQTQCAVLLADISGSTRLYEAVGDDEAARRVGRCIDWMQDLIEANGGRFIAAKGDDVLATFHNPDAGLKTAQAIMAEMPMGGLSVHAGLNFGPVVETRGDIFGDTVNLTARLASLANPGEVLVSRALVDHLSEQASTNLRLLSSMRFKGKEDPIEVFAPIADTEFFEPNQTQLAQKPAATGIASATLQFDGAEWVIEEGANITIGRSADSDLVVDRPWVSRQHATLAITGGRLQFTDRSSYGSFLIIGDAAELTVRRETVVVTSDARLSPGASVGSPDAAIISIVVNNAWEPDS